MRQDVQYAEGVLVVANNDLAYADSDEQHIEDTIIAEPGHYKENYTDGVAINSFLNASGAAQEISRKMRLELAADQYPKCYPTVEQSPAGNLTINPNVIL